MSFYKIKEDRDNSTFEAKASVYGLELDDFQIDVNEKFGIENRESVLASIKKKETKVTDFLSTNSLGGSGYLISYKVKRILEKHNLPKHCFTQVDMEMNKSLNYYVFFVDSSDVEVYIDFNESLFFLANKFNRDKNRQDGFVKIGSLEEIKKLDKMNKPNKLIVYFERIVLKPEFKDTGYDIFGLPIPGRVDKYFSESLIKDFEDNNITGYKSRVTKRVVYQKC